MTLNFTKKVSVVTTEKCELQLNSEDICRLLRLAGIVIPVNASDVCIDFRVPGGGDWSNATIDIDSDHPVRVEWSIKRTEERDG